MKTFTDEELVRLYVETQRNEYFEALYSRYCDKVYRKCLSFSKDQAKAEDYTHDIFLRLIVKIGSFRQEAKFSTWLFSVTYNYCMDQVRSRNKAEVYSEDSYEGLANYHEDDDADLAEMEVQQLKRSLIKLTPEEQSLLLMKYQDDFSIRDIAEMLHLTESAVKMRLKRSKDKLRKYYMESFIFWVVVGLKALLSFKWPLHW